MRKIIIDTDCGSDDAVAIAMALREPGVEVIMITVVAGNVPLFQAVDNTLVAIEYAGTYNPPVYAGCDIPILRAASPSYDTHGFDGMGDMGYKPAKLKANSENAVFKLLEALNSADEGTIEIICLGPLTNIAIAIRLDPRAVQRAKRVTAMGSAGFGIGNVTPVAEFNIWQDAEAAHIVLGAGLEQKLLFVGWDACLGDAIFDEENIKNLRMSGQLGAFCIDCNKSLMELNFKRWGKRVLDFADPVAMAVALWPEVVAKQGFYHCQIGISPCPGYGQFIIDRNAEFGQKPNAWVCTQVDAGIYKTMMNNVLK